MWASSDIQVGRPVALQRRIPIGFSSKCPTQIWPASSTSRCSMASPTEKDKISRPCAPKTLTWFASS
ncbi:hypothetical protein [Streptomyces sp. CS147]|uniref:hypothetical protein n=1 Tax=Streptomyces sp. CS147 TaxID=2162715 RepID=UPI0013A5B8A2|nr:hypothetical protein [Streptomyces sp. CS147]